MSEVKAKRVSKASPADRENNGETEERSEVKGNSPSFGVILGPDGKPCRACTDFKSWAKQMRGGSPGVNDFVVKNRASEDAESKRMVIATINDTRPSSTSSYSTSTIENTDVQARNDCPVDKEELGRNTWSFLHTMAAYYPENPTSKQQKDMKSFINLFAKFYPCDWCAHHMRKSLKDDDPDTTSQEALSQWFCDYHNEVNRRLGKKEFDCSKVFERWKTGWADGSCD